MALTPEAFPEEQEIAASAILPSHGLRGRIVSGLIWRSGSQIVAQLVTWSATFIVIRILTPHDYGLFAMTQTVMVLLGMLSGGSIANALIRADRIDRDDIARMFGLLILINLTLMGLQYALAPLVAAYYRQPMLTQILRVQTLAYLALPFIGLGTSILAQRLDFRNQALANLLAALVSATIALTGALSNWGIWTLVLAPLALFWVRAIILALGTGLFVTLPSFNFRGMAPTVNFGIAVIASQLLWFVQTQSDVFIGGRVLGPERLGYYTTALFLTQIITAKMIPPINDVAYSAYARLHNEGMDVSGPFIQAAQWVMMVVLPLYFGLAMTSGPLVEVVLGDHWRPSAPLIAVLAVAMPCYALQILFAPATNALGKPRIAVLTSLFGAILMPIAFIIGVQWGRWGLACAWLVTMPLLLLFTAHLSLPLIGARGMALARALLPPVLAALAMLPVIALVRANTEGLAPALRLLFEVLAGGSVYILAISFLARGALMALITTVRSRGTAG